MSKIAILASGRGSNAENIIKYFSKNGDISVDVVITNRESAGVVEKAKTLGVKVEYIPNIEIKKEGVLTKLFKQYKIDYIVLAGYLQLIPRDVISVYRGKILNIHPALLPAFGGHGMYGMNVHNAVKESGATHSGITIHHVCDEYDTGANIFQAGIEIDPLWDAQEIAERVAELEMKHFPTVIESFINSNI